MEFQIPIPDYQHQVKHVSEMYRIPKVAQMENKLDYWRYRKLGHNIHEKTSWTTGGGLSHPESIIEKKKIIQIHY